MPASGSYTSAVKVFKIMPEENCILKSNKKSAAGEFSCGALPD
jgi:hypothetical protein